MIELIDLRNEKLWNALNENYNISFAESHNGEYGCYCKEKDVIFYVDNKNYCKDSFTHEMLHVFLKLKNNYIAASLEMTVRQSKILSSAISFQLLEHMGNCLDHIKMLPLYLDLGFNRTKFISDYNVNKCNIDELNTLRKLYRTGKFINSKAFDFYIGKLISILADPNPNLDYSSQIKALKKIDSLLFQIVDETVKHWKQIKIDEREIFDDDHRSVITEFYEKMKKWISINKLC